MNLDDDHIGYVYIPKIGLTYKLYNKGNLKNQKRSCST